MFLHHKQIKTHSALSSGFTLIEIICVLVLLGLMASFISASFLRPIASHINADNDYQQAQKNQAALLRMILEMKSSTGVSVAGNVVSYNFTPTGEDRKISVTGAYLYLYIDADDQSTKHILTDNVSSFTVSLASGIMTPVLTTTFSGSTQKAFTTSISLQ